ncbi:peptidase U32 family protein, partial [Streptococcus hyovaginalis]
MVKKPERLGPAGNLVKLKIADTYGADAVFIGGQEYGLRSNAGNFTFEEMKEGVEFAKQYQAKIIVTTNIFAKNENIAGFKENLMVLKLAILPLLRGPRPPKVWALCSPGTPKNKP